MLARRASDHVHAAPTAQPVTLSPPAVARSSPVQSGRARHPLHVQRLRITPRPASTAGLAPTAAPARQPRTCPLTRPQRAHAARQRPPGCGAAPQPRPAPTQDRGRSRPRSPRPDAPPHRAPARHVSIRSSSSACSAPASSGSASWSIRSSTARRMRLRAASRSAPCGACGSSSQRSIRTVRRTARDTRSNVAASASTAPGLRRQPARLRHADLHQLQQRATASSRGIAVGRERNGGAAGHSEHNKNTPPPAWSRRAASHPGIAAIAGPPVDLALDHRPRRLRQRRLRGVQPPRRRPGRRLARPRDRRRPHGRRPPQQPPLAAALVGPGRARDHAGLDSASPPKRTPSPSRTRSPPSRGSSAPARPRSARR